MKAAPPVGCVEVNFEGAEGVTLKGWRGGYHGKCCGTLIYLHGLEDKRASGAGVMEYYLKKGSTLSHTTAVLTVNRVARPALTDFSKRKISGVF